MGASARHEASSARIERIRNDCSKALDLLRDSANRARPGDPFTPYLNNCLMQVSLVLDTIEEFNSAAAESSTPQQNAESEAKP